MIDDIKTDAAERMGKSVNALDTELAKLRTGRAHPSLLEHINVSYYGADTPLNQVAALNIADPRLITIKPWDKSLLVEIEKALVASNLGITPNNDGEIIRLPIPPLTGERRKELIKRANNTIPP